MIKIKLGDLKTSEAALRKLMGASLPISASFKLSKLVDSVGTELQRIEQVRVDLVTKLGETQEDGSVSINDPDKLDNFNKEYSDFLNTEVEIAGDPVTITELGTNLEISPIEIKTLSAFIAG